jgi:hypothetical protein
MKPTMFGFVIFLRLCLMLIYKNTSSPVIGVTLVFVLGEISSLLQIFFNILKKIESNINS